MWKDGVRWGTSVKEALDYMGNIKNRESSCLLLISFSYLHISLSEKLPICLPEEAGRKHPECSIFNTNVLHCREQSF